MDFNQAIAAHSAWKQKLASYLKTKDGSLKAGEIGVDNECPLGKWIYGEGSKFSSLPEFSTLRSEHARLHKAAAEGVCRADGGKSVIEEIAIGSKSEFASASQAVVSAIMKIKHHAE